MTLQSVSQDQHFEYIDGLRGIAVLAVVLFHAFRRVPGPHFAPDLFYAGTRGVDLFFVLSGFCLSLRAVAASPLENGKAIRPVQFMISRFARVAPPYYLALGLFAVLSFTPFGLPTARSSPVALAALPELLRDVWFNVSRSPVYNASFWTLGFEMRWYFLYPLLISVFLRSKIGFACVALGAYAWYATPWRIADAGTLPCFMLGIVAASLATTQARPPRGIVVPAAIIVLFFALAKQSGSVDTNHGDALWHLACFLIVLAGGYGAARRLLSAKPIRSIGIASYSIYLVHQPFLEWFVTHGVPPALAALASVGMGLGFWFTIERVAAKSWRTRFEMWTSAKLPATPTESLLDNPAITRLAP